MLTHTYGKSNVRISKVRRPRRAAPTDERHDFIECSVDIHLQGDFDAAYTQRDNRQVIATDTIRNTVYLVAQDDPLERPETFGRALATHFLDRYPQVSRATATLTQRHWRRLLDCDHAFSAGEAETATAVCTADRGAGLTLTAGLARLLLAKTTQSGFTGFHRDDYRTLPDAEDRILATELTATWRFTDATHTAESFGATASAVRHALLNEFITGYSHSVQETLHRMATAALNAAPAISAVTLNMPNRHHIPFDMSPFDRTNDNEIFIVTDAPAGYIEATLTR